MDSKGIEITTTALLKSIIENPSIPPSDWEERLKEAVSLWVKTSNLWKEQS